MGGKTLGAIVSHALAGLRLLQLMIRASNLGERSWRSFGMRPAVLQQPISASSSPCDPT